MNALVMKKRVTKKLVMNSIVSRRHYTEFASQRFSVRLARSGRSTP
jgi:hypothetical protein